MSRTFSRPRLRLGAAGGRPVVVVTLPVSRAQVTRLGSAGRARCAPLSSTCADDDHRVVHVDEPGVQRGGPEAHAVGHAVVRDDAAGDQLLHQLPGLRVLEHDVRAAGGGVARRGQADAVRGEPLVGELDEVGGQGLALGAQPRQPGLGQQPHALPHGEHARRPAVCR